MVSELNKQIDRITGEIYSNQPISSEKIKQFNGVSNIEYATLFADFGGSTNLVDRYDHKFASWLLKSYLICASSIICKSGGQISAFEGDGLMGLFSGNLKESYAVQCAFKIQWAVTNIIQPKINELFPEKKYQMSQVVGIDTSELSAINTEIWEHYDLLWIGRSANYAANLTRVNDPNYSTYITSEVYMKLPTELREKNNILWELMTDKLNEAEIYRSNCMISLI